MNADGNQRHTSTCGNCQDKKGGEKRGNSGCCCSNYMLDLLTSWCHHSVSVHIYPGQVIGSSQGWHRETRHTNTLIQAYGQFKVISEPHIHVFGWWDEAIVPRENTHGHGENKQTLTHKERPNRGSNPGTFLLWASPCCLSYFFFLIICLF